MADNFQNMADTVVSPARKAFNPVQTDADTAIDPLPKAVRCQAAGTIKYRAVDSAVDVTETVAAGERLDVRMLYIRDTGTTLANSEMVCYA